MEKSHYLIYNIKIENKTFEHTFCYIEMNPIISSLEISDIKTFQMIIYAKLGWQIKNINICFHENKYGLSEITIMGFFSIKSMNFSISSN